LDSIGNCKNGVFTNALLKGLRGGAFVDDRNWISLDELGSYVQRNIGNTLQDPNYGNLVRLQGQNVFFKPLLLGKEVPPHPADPVEKPISTKSELPFVKVK